MKLKCLRLSLLAVLSFVASVAFAQTKKIAGKILNDEAKPISGVSVTIKGKQGGTQTNTNGEYSIDAANGDAAGRQAGFLGKGRAGQPRGGGSSQAELSAAGKELATVHGVCSCCAKAAQRCALCC